VVIFRRKLRAKVRIRLFNSYVDILLILLGSAQKRGKAFGSLTLGQGARIRAFSKGKSPIPPAPIVEKRYKVLVSIILRTYETEELESSFTGRSIPISITKKFLSLEEYQEAQNIQIELQIVEQFNTYVKLIHRNTLLFANMVLYYSQELSYKDFAMYLAKAFLSSIPSLEDWELYRWITILERANGVSFATKVSYYLLVSW